MNQPLRNPGGYHSSTAKKSSSASPLLLILVILVACLLVVVIGVGGWLLLGNRGDTTASTDDVPAVSDALTQEQLQRLRDTDLNPNATWEIPVSIDDALIQLAARDRQNSNSFDLQQQVAAEYLYGCEIDESKREEVSRTLATTFQVDFGSSQEKIVLLKTFRRWGLSEHLPQLFVEMLGESQRGSVKGRKGYGDDAVLEHLLRAAEEHPTVAVAPWLGGLLSTSVGDQAERVLRQIGPEVAPYLVSVHNSDDTEAVARTTRLLDEFGSDETDLKIDYILSRTKDDSSWDRRAAFAKLASVPFDATYQDKVVNLLVATNPSEGLSQESWLKAVLVWGDERCLPAVTSMLREGHYWDSDKSLPFIKKFGDVNSIDTLITMLLADHYVRDRPQIAEAVITLCASNPGVDLKTHVHQPILRQVHDFYSSDVDAIWRVLRATDFDTKLLVEQSLSDLGSQDSSRERAAWETMSSMDVDESLRGAVSEKMALLLEDELSISDQERLSFLRWAAPGHPLMLKWLRASYVSDDDFQEIMSVVVNAPVNNELLIVVADSLADEKKQRAMFEILLTKCNDPATIAVGLFDSSNPVVLQAACNILGEKGTNEHMQALGDLNAKAKKARVTPVINASKEAGQKIRARYPN
ncbi:MAG: hypothetical protein GY904_28740 [Planctomycetaceae bacterium]|nr:hypothetical protein [Planctomycetaceae bacterium]